MEGLKTHRTSDISIHPCGVSARSADSSKKSALEIDPHGITGRDHSFSGLGSISSRHPTSDPQRSCPKWTDIPSFSCFLLSSKNFDDLPIPGKGLRKVAFSTVSKPSVLCVCVFRWRACGVRGPDWKQKNRDFGSV